MADLTDEAKAELAAAVAIVREDRIFSMLAKVTAPKPEDPPKPDPKPGDPPPPPAPKPDDPLPEKRGLWWGDQVKDPE